MIDNAANYMYQGALVAAERASGKNDNMVSPHFHDFYEIYYLESGERYHMIEGKLFKLSSGQLSIFKPNELHYSYGDKDVSFSRLLVYFDKSTIKHKEILSVLPDISGVYQINTTKNAEIYHLMNQILNEQNYENDFYMENMSNYVNQIVVNMLRNKSNKIFSTEDTLISQIITYINSNYMHKITVDEIAEHLFISKWHLCRKFKESTNDTIIQYLNKVRIIEAQKLLLESNKNITLISTEVGFESVTHFERVFKQMLFMTPTKYRKIN